MSRYLYHQGSRDLSKHDFHLSWTENHRDGGSEEFLVFLDLRTSERRGPTPMLQCKQGWTEGPESDLKKTMVLLKPDSSEVLLASGSLNHRDKVLDCLILHSERRPPAGNL